MMGIVELSSPRGLLKSFTSIVGSFGETEAWRDVGIDSQSLRGWIWVGIQVSRQVKSASWKLKAPRRDGLA